MASSKKAGKYMLLPAALVPALNPVICLDLSFCEWTRMMELSTPDGGRRMNCFPWCVCALGLRISQSSFL